MPVLITSIICGLIINISLFNIIKKLIDSNEKLMKIKNVFLIIFLCIIYAVFYKKNYSIIYIIANYLSIMLFNKIIFKENMMKTIISTSIVLILLMLSDFLDSVIMVNFVSFSNVRTSDWLRILNNIIVGLLCFILFSIPIIKTKCKYFILKYEIKRFPILTLVIILVLSIITITYGMSVSFKWTIEYFANVFIVFTLITFFYIFINENNQYNKLNDEYDNLFKCIQTFEDWIEKEQLNRHEYKNQLAVLRCMTKEKKVKEKIDNIISDNININNDTINQLKPIPNGGLKGLLYYKIVIAEKNKINLEIDVSLNNKNILNKLSEEKMKIVCRLIGIYFDNAIEAAKETRKRIVSLEVYEYGNLVNIVISNTFKKNKNISKRNEKGFTTKGKGHGKGLYFAKKMINNNSWINEEQSIISRFYTQKIIIQKKDI